MNSLGILSNESTVAKKIEVKSMEVLTLETKLAEQAIESAMNEATLLLGKIEIASHSSESLSKLGKESDSVAKEIGIESVAQGLGIEAEQAKDKNILQRIWAAITDSLAKLWAAIKKMAEQVKAWFGLQADAFNTATGKLQRIIDEKGHGNLSTSKDSISLGSNSVDLKDYPIGYVAMYNGKVLNNRDLVEINKLSDKVSKNMAVQFDTSKNNIIAKGIIELGVMLKSLDKEGFDIKTSDDLPGFDTILSKLDKDIEESNKAAKESKLLSADIAKFENVKAETGLTVGKSGIDIEGLEVSGGRFWSSQSNAISISESKELKSPKLDFKHIPSSFVSSCITKITSDVSSKIDNDRITTPVLLKKLTTISLPISKTIVSLIDVIIKGVKTIPKKGEEAKKEKKEDDKK